MKRFYKAATLTDAAGGFAILLDGKDVRTPAKRPLVLPTKALAEAVREEWAQQGADIVPHDMPMMQLSATMIDRVTPVRDHVVEALSKFGESDLVCYRATHPATLVERQHSLWQPLVEFAAEHWGAALVVTSGLMPVEQPTAAVEALRRRLAAHADPSLTAVMAATAAAGSLVIGLALAEGRLDAAEAFQAGQLDETYQIDVWGEDVEAVERLDHLRAEMEAAHKFLGLSRDLA